MNKKEFEKIKNLMSTERKLAKISNQQLLNGLLYIIENGCKWRTLPKRFGNWHTIQFIVLALRYTLGLPESER